MRNDKECATGVPGEYCIRSSTLMKGYWNRPDLSAKAFLNIQTPGRLPKQFYRTGDKVVRQENGQLRFLGRLDRMVKTRGHRVELDEVEAVIASHENVLEVAAFTVPDEHGSVSILAAVTLKKSNTLDIGLLFKLARTKLPIYAIPQDIIEIHHIPHTSTGKIDRRSLEQVWRESVNSSTNKAQIQHPQPETTK